MDSLDRLLQLDYDFEALAQKLEMCALEEMHGKVPAYIFAQPHLQAVLFICTNGEVFLLKHFQFCCESVRVEQVDGDEADMYGHKLEMVEESSEYDRGETRLWGWTFYKFRSHGGDLTIRFHGTSNGYYSIGVDTYKGVLLDLPEDVQVLCDKKLQELTTKE